MTRDEITERATNVVRQQWCSTQSAACPPVSANTDFEEEFDLEVPDQDAEGLKTFGQAVEYLAGKLAVAA